MNDMTQVPRHRQKAIAIRSDKAARLLAKLTRDGRSQAQVIEDALEKVEADAPKLTKEDFIAQVKAIVVPLHGRLGKSREEIEAEMYDEYGAPR